MVSQGRLQYRSLRGKAIDKSNVHKLIFRKVKASYDAARGWRTPGREVGAIERIWRLTWKPIDKLVNEVGVVLHQVLVEMGLRVLKVAGELKSR